MTALAVEIERSDSEARRHFTVEVGEPTMVLDVLLALQRTDASLAFRYSCRVAMCGTCTIRVDGRPVLACRTPVLLGADGLLLEPLAGLPVVRDLIVDTTPFSTAWRSVEPWFTPRADAEPRVLAADDPSREAIESGLDCISCGACWTACDLAGAEHRFLGPAALNRAMTLAADARDGARDRRLRLVSQEGGVTRCHYIHGCSGACPKGIDPAASIRRLRRWSIGAGR
ncbi:MAG: 2Fe-2S iron-sulfur cluster-binding protein [Gaiellaceae bacterium MAG52_C11]|nr:2Fe-2S iron-sulfur cluster-binding protein [Candidatus Gaiellasilicea maunaloa]